MAYLRVFSDVRGVNGTGAKICPRALPYCERKSVGFIEVTLFLRFSVKEKEKVSFDFLLLSICVHALIRSSCLLVCSIGNNFVSVLFPKSLIRLPASSKEGISL